MICFIHIEKTAGTTLDYIFINNFIYYYSLESWHKWTNQKGTYFYKDEFKNMINVFPFIKGIGGHSLRNWLEYEKYKKNIKYITFLRNPIARYLSHYRHQKFKMNIQWKIGDFLNEERFDNYMTFRFSEAGNLDEAKKNLKKIDFIGLQEEFDLSLLLMKFYLGKPGLCINYESKNINHSAKETFNSLIKDKNIKNKIIEKNKKDIELYNFAKNELFEIIKSGYPFDIKNQLDDFRNKNMVFRPSRRKQLIHKITKFSMIRPFEIIQGRRKTKEHQWRTVQIKP